MCLFQASHIMESHWRADPFRMPASAQERDLGTIMGNACLGLLRLYNRDTFSTFVSALFPVHSGMLGLGTDSAGSDLVKEAFSSVEGNCHLHVFHCG